MSSNRDKAIELAARYKEIEAEIFTVQNTFPHFKRREPMAKLLREAAVIANRLKMLGYSLPELIKKRQERESHDN